jgi:Ser/Thr protein kinase RdoA (MazF antagonist)
MTIADLAGGRARLDDLPYARQLECLGELAAAALGRYGIEVAEPPRLVNLSENATFKVHADTGREFALRVHREGYHSKRAIASELAWLQALRQDGVVVTPIPVPGLDGEQIQRVGHPAMAAPRHVVLFAWERGREPSPWDRLVEKFAVLGEVAAKMHRHSEGWRRPRGFERHTWDFETSLGARPHWGRWADGIGIDGATAGLFARAVDLIGRRLDRFGTPPERFGLIHCDMRLANLLIDGDTVKVIDFDDCGFSWHLYDAAAAVSFFEHEPHVPELLSAWLGGYRKVLPLSAAEEAEMQTFVMLRRMLLVAWIGSHSETELARSMGVGYTEQTAPMCEDYLTHFG